MKSDLVGVSFEDAKRWCPVLQWEPRLSRRLKQLFDSDVREATPLRLSRVQSRSHVSAVLSCVLQKALMEEYALVDGVVIRDMLISAYSTTVQSSGGASRDGRGVAGGVCSAMGAGVGGIAPPVLRRHPSGVVGTSPVLPIIGSCCLYVLSIFISFYLFLSCLSPLFSFRSLSASGFSRALVSPSQLA
jgi:hypothetical protein